MTEDITELTRQRDALTARIEQARADRADAWNEGLDAIAQALDELAAERGWSAGVSRRKNVETHSYSPGDNLRRSVSAELGYIESEYGPRLAVKTGALPVIEAVFSISGPPPPPSVITALVVALIEREP